MAKNKTTETESRVADYLAGIKDDKRRTDCAAIIELLTKETGIEPKMWGTGIVGFGSYHYKYDSGHEGDAPLAGLASRANAITLYVHDDDGNKAALLAKLGKYKMGKGCIYIKKLEDIDTGILAQLVKNSIEYKRKLYPG